MDLNEIKRTLEKNKLNVDKLWRSLWHRSKDNWNENAWRQD